MHRPDFIDDPKCGPRWMIEPGEPWFVQDPCNHDTDYVVAAYFDKLSRPFSIAIPGTEH